MSNNWYYDRQFLLNGLPSFEQMDSIKATYISEYTLNCNDGESKIVLTKTMTDGKSTFTSEYHSQSIGGNGVYLDIIDRETFFMFSKAADAHVEKIIYKYYFKQTQWEIVHFLKSCLGTFIMGIAKVHHMEEEIELFDSVDMDVTNDIRYQDGNIPVRLK